MSEYIWCGSSVWWGQIMVMLLLVWWRANQHIECLKIKQLIFSVMGLFAHVGHTDVIFSQSGFQCLIFILIYIYIYYLPVNPRRLYSWINLIQQWPFLCSLFHGCTVATWLARRKMKMTFFPRTKLWLVDSYSTAIKNSINGITAPDLFESEFRSVMRAMQPVVVFMTSSEQILQ